MILFSPDSITLTSRKFAAVQTPVPLDKLNQCHMNWITFLAYSDDFKHAQIFKLVQNQLFIVIVWCLLHVWLDAAHIPAIMLY